MTIEIHYKWKLFLELWNHNFWFFHKKINMLKVEINKKYLNQKCQSLRSKCNWNIFISFQAITLNLILHRVFHYLSKFAFCEVFKAKLQVWLFALFLCVQTCLRFSVLVHFHIIPCCWFQQFALSKFLSREMPLHNITYIDTRHSGLFRHMLQCGQRLLHVIVKKLIYMNIKLHAVKFLFHILL